MGSFEFIIPNYFEDVEKVVSTQFRVTVLSTSDIAAAVTAAASAANHDGPDFIVEHFSTFYSVIKNFKDVSAHSQEKSFKIVFKSFEKWALTLRSNLEHGLDGQVLLKYRNVSKMLGFILIEIAQRFQDHYAVKANPIKVKGKKVRSEAAEEWSETVAQLMSTIYDFLEVPIKLMWDPPVVDDEFIKIFANFSYKLLEDKQITSNEKLRSNIFQVLATLIRRHMHGLSFSVKIVQLLKTHDHLVNPLADGVIDIYKSDCKQIFTEIVREMSSERDALLSEGVAGWARNLSQFLSASAEKSAHAVAPAAELLLDFLNRDPYSLRCGVLSVLGDVVKSTLTKEGLDEDDTNMRDKYLDALQEHIHDGNSFARARALQVWQKLCTGTPSALPVARQHELLELAINRLEDKCANVKKHAVHLIAVMLESNPYAMCPFDIPKLSKKIQVAEDELKSLLIKHNLNRTEASRSEWDRLEQLLRNELSKSEQNSVAVDAFTDGVQDIAFQLKLANIPRVVAVYNHLKLNYADLLAEYASDSAEDDLDFALKCIGSIWEESLRSEVPDISEDVIQKKGQLEYKISYNKDAREFATLMEKALPPVVALLNSTTQTDVLEAVTFIVATHRYGFPQALLGVRKMLDLVFSKDANVKKAVCSAYQDLYFSNEKTGREKHLESVKKLSELIIQLNESQLQTMSEVVKYWIQNKVIEKPCIQVLFEKFAKKIAGTSESDSWAALVVISMIGTEKPEVLSDNLSVLITEGLGKRASDNFLLAHRTCKALKNLSQSPKGYKFSGNDELLCRLRRLLKEGLWCDSSQHHFIPFADECLSLVFAVAERPDHFADELLVDMFHSIKEGKRPLYKEPKGRKLHVSSQQLEDELSGDELGDEAPNETQPANVDNSDEAIILRLTRFISILGSTASQYALFLEGPVANEHKRRNQIEFDRRIAKHEGQSGREELEMIRQSEDDRVMDELRVIADSQVVAGQGSLAKFFPFILNICKHPNQYRNQSLQNAALNTLGMYMQVSQVVCANHLQLLVSIATKSRSTELLRNGLALSWAMQFTFPSLFDGWTHKIIQLLLHETAAVRRIAVIIISDLIINDMLKARGASSVILTYLAALTVDKDKRIAEISRYFFREFAKKGNDLYNNLSIMVLDFTKSDTRNVEQGNSEEPHCTPEKTNLAVKQEPRTPLGTPRLKENGTPSQTIPGQSPCTPVALTATVKQSCTPSKPKPSVCDSGPFFLEEDNFHQVMKFIMPLVGKDKQQDLLVEKLCQSFAYDVTDRQCRDLAFCLSLITYSEKSLRKIFENFHCFGNKLFIAEVYEAFLSIIAQGSRNPQKDRNLIDDLQSLVTEYREKSCLDRNVTVELVRNKRCPPSTKKRGPRRQISDSDEDEPVTRSTRKAAAPRRRRMQANTDSDNSSEDDIFVKKKTSLQRVTSTQSSDSEPEFAPKLARSSKRAPSKKSRVKKISTVYEDDSDDDIPNRKGQRR